MRISDWSSDVCSSDLSTGIDERCIIMISSGKYGGNRLCHFARVRIVEHAMSRFQPQVPAEAILTAQFIAQAEHQSPIVEIRGNHSRLPPHPFAYFKLLQPSPTPPLFLPVLDLPRSLPPPFLSLPFFPPPPFPPPNLNP